MKCKTCPEELTIIKPDGFSMRICERCRTGCEVKKASGQTCFPLERKPITCDACEAEVDAHYELYEIPFYADVNVCKSCLDSCCGVLSLQAELANEIMKLKEVKL